MISAGRVLLMPKGDYDPTVTYELLDIVSYNGSSYIAKGTTTGNLPTNTTYWQLSAYRGQASNLAGNFAPLETTEYATRAYATDDIFVDKDSQLVIATDAINIGDEIVIGSNCETTTIADLLDDIKNHYDALDQRNRKLIGITQLTAQTDLHLLVPGEYYKKLTTFYVTNAPTGINQVPTAVFRLTVESGLDESGSSLLLTLRTIEGKTYTQAYDGSTWSDWKEVGDITDVPTYTGATSISDGVKGLVPAATASERNNYFKGDGTWGALGTAAAKNSTNAVTSGSTALVESGAVYGAIQTVNGEIQSLDGEIQTLDRAKADKALIITLPNVSSSKLSFTSADVAKISKITANHVLTGYCVFSNPSAQGSDWTITTAANSIVIQGTVSGTTNLTLGFIEQA